MKVGDTVLCTKGEGSLVAGMTYTVTRVVDGRWLYVTGNGIKDHGGWPIGNFEQLTS